MAARAILSRAILSRAILSRRFGSSLTVATIASTAPSTLVAAAHSTATRSVPPLAAAAATRPMTTTTTTTKPSTTTTTTTTASIEAVFVFHRHGDRTPGKSLVGEERRDEEAAFWNAQIPSRSLRRALSARFPVRHDSPSGEEDTKDDDTYGCLTRKGLRQMRATGISLAHRYGSGAVAVAGDDDRNNDSSGRNDNDNNNNAPFLRRETWETRVVSTNYERTILSCQALLDGLLSPADSRGNHPRLDLPAESEATKGKDARTRYETLSPGESTTTKTTTDDENENDDDDDPRIPIEVSVRDPAAETLNAFDASPTKMSALLALARATPEFREADRAAQPLAKELAELLPGLASSTSRSSDSIEINWVDAADHFVCRTSHGGPPERFALKGSRASGRHGYRALGEATAEHLRTRFHRYYSHPGLLSAMAGPALREVFVIMQWVAIEAEVTAKQAHRRLDNADRKPRKKPFRIYSCHDVTILALLYALQGNASTAAAATSEPEEVIPRWPSYGTCLTLELIKESTEDGSSTPRFVVRAHTSEPPVPPAVVSPTVPLAIGGADLGESSSAPSPDAIELERFQKLLYDLTAAGVEEAIKKGES